MTTGTTRTTDPAITPGVPESHAGHTPGRTNRGWLAGGALVLGALALWEIAVTVSGTPVYLVPAPSDIARVLGDDAAGLLPAALVTLLEALGGLAIGSALGLSFAIIITFWSQLERGVLTIALLLKSTPIIAVAPILTIWLGFGHSPKVVVTALLTFFPVLVNALEGFRSVDPAIMRWLHSIDAPPRQVFLHARWPAAWPFLFAALKVAAPLSLIGAVVAEWMGASSGLGREMWLAYNNLDMPSLFAAVVVLTFVSACVYQVVASTERRVMRWQ